MISNTLLILEALTLTTANPVNFRWMMQNMFDLLRDTYDKSSVIVTGHTGFKGGWLGLWLSLLGARVIGYSLEPPSQPSFFETTNLGTRICHIIGDVRELTHLKQVFKEHQPTFVFHLAAQSLVQLSYKEPHLTYATNVMGTVNVLEVIRSTESVRAAVIVTSDKCYENREMIWGYREIDRLGGHDPYSSSKGCAELVTSAYQKSYFSPDAHLSTHQVALASARAGNIIGGGDWGDNRLIPDCVRALSQNKPIRLRNPRAVRPWQYVLDPLMGYLLLGARLNCDGTQFSGSWNFGPLELDAWCVEDLVRNLIRIWGNGSYEPADDPGHHEAGWLKLDSNKAFFNLGWRPFYSKEEALKKSISWYKLYYQAASEEELLDYSIDQIRGYMSK